MMVMEAKISEAERPDSGLRSAQEEISRRDQRIGWLACLNWLVGNGVVPPHWSKAAHDAMEDELKRLREGGR